MNVTLKDLIPMLICDDVRESIAFYETYLGFRVRHRMDDVGKSGWAHLENGRAAIMLASPTYFPPTPRIDGRHHTCIHYFYPEDVRALREAVIARGGAASELQERFYGMLEFEMTDPSGHILVFGQHASESAQSREGAPTR